ncbi:MAG: hypothetical protein U5N86_02430 [Planctomycetota bacterium]|nr:hypothetical protein [Planctomycetota bacterium]
MVRISPNLSEKALFSNTAFTDTVRVYIGISSKPIRSEIRKSWPLSVAPKYDCPWYRYGEIILGGWITPLDKDGLVMKAIERANQTKGFAGFCGYQSENPKERRSKVIQQIMILYDYFARQGIKYLNSTLSFESAQRIRPPAEVIRTKSGNCIELTLLFASCLEAVGLRTHIVLIPNHAFLAVSTKNSNYDSLSLDKDLLFLECTCIGGAPFEKALEVGEINFNKNRKIIFEDNRYGFLLVEKLREYNYRPNPNF